MIRKFSPSARCRTVAILLISFAAHLTACQSTDPQMTSTAVYEEARAGLERQLATATVARARMQTTLDHAATRVGQAEEASQFLRSNLISLGTDSAFIEDNLRQLQDVATQSPPTAAAPALSAPAAGDASPAMTPRTVINPPIVTPAPTAVELGPRLENVVMASGVDSFDCAIDVNPAFSPRSRAIYVVGRAFNIPAGATISSSWQHAGAEVVHFSFHREHEINDSCIWFYIDQTDTPFTAGSWSVEIRVDGLPLASPVAFQIVSN
ncbi:MAG: hypothetical protein OXN88_11555 [Chloroflexota bacterium]|nr:hypothetical protein [Chloroflexota bacterium]